MLTPIAVFNHDYSSPNSKGGKVDSLITECVTDKVTDVFKKTPFLSISMLASLKDNWQIYISVITESFAYFRNSESEIQYL